MVQNNNGSSIRIADKKDHNTNLLLSLVESLDISYYKYDLFQNFIFLYFLVEQLFMG